MALETKQQDTEVECAFCRGKGKDPFDLLSSLAQCEVGEGKEKLK